MRDLRPGARRSAAREHHRARYAAYMAAPEWFARRDRWAAEERARNGSTAIVCFGGCGTLWEPRTGDLHHVSYTRLGDEAHEDLWALCRPCHDLLHQLLESTRTWRRLPRSQANLLALAALREQHRRAAQDPDSSGEPGIEAGS